MASAKTLDQIIKELPSQARHELYDFAFYLWDRYKRKTKISSKKISTKGVRGALKNLRKEFTSVELQHKLREWW